MTTGTCIICYKTWDSVDTIGKKGSNRRHKFFRLFCRRFGIPPLDNVHRVQWNFAQEQLPFCPSCHDKADKLVKLQKSLDSIRKSIILLQRTIKGQIVNSSGSHNLDVNQTKDSRVVIIRDLIIGPVLSIPKLKLTEIPKIKYYDSTPSMNLSYFDNFNDDAPSPMSDTHNSEDDFNSYLNAVEHVEVKLDPEENCLTPLFEEEDVEISNQKVYPTHPRRKVSLIQANPYAKLYNNRNYDDDDEDDEDYKFKIPFIGDPVLDSNFEPSEEDLQDYDQQMSKKYVIRQKRREDSEKKIIHHVVKLEAGKYSYRGYEFEEDQDGITCSTCSKKFNLRCGLFAHVQSHHLKETKTHLCAACGRGFYKESQLRKHILIHEEGQPVICHLCGGTYRTEFLLSKHIALVHDAVYNFPCDQCSDKFKSDRRLKQHINKFHSSRDPHEKPRKIPSNIPCEFCDLTFRWKENHQKHVKRFHSELTSTDNMNSSIPDHRPYACPHCNERYLREGTLNYHIKRVHSRITGDLTTTPMFSCDFCDKKYTTFHTKRKHERKFHKNEPGFQMFRKRNKYAFPKEIGHVQTDEGQEEEEVPENLIEEVIMEQYHLDL